MKDRSDNPSHTTSERSYQGAMSRSLRSEQFMDENTEQSKEGPGNGVGGCVCTWIATEKHGNKHVV